MSFRKRIEQISDPVKMQQRAIQVHKEGKSIGFVPTMGYFHQGHLSLMHAARKETDCVMVSLFVNPIQFGPSEDFARYPKDMERDLDMATQAGVDILFSPTTKQMYPSGFRTHVEVEGLSEMLCGLNRPGHFRGVTTVVCKLFNLLRPDVAYFGQKDAQQAIIIKKMAEDLNMGIQIRILPIVREKDGLAMSSRNVYLSEKERQAALCLYKAIKHTQQMVKDGERHSKVLKTQAEAVIRCEPLAELEYITIRHPGNLSYLERIEDEALLALAVKIGKTRLIDNTILKTKKSKPGQAETKEV